MEAPKIVLDICQLVRDAPVSTIKRLRFAVSPEEMKQIRAYALVRDGYFAFRIRNIPLIVEHEPEAPPVVFTTEPKT